MTPITLPPFTEIKAKALEALNNNALQCQQPDFKPFQSKCDYSGPCAIGAALSPEDAKALDDYRDHGGSSSSIGSLLRLNIVTLHPDDQNNRGNVSLALGEVQALHDAAKIEELKQYLSHPNPLF